MLQEVCLQKTERLCLIVFACDSAVVSVLFAGPRSKHCLYWYRYCHGAATFIMTTATASLVGKRESHQVRRRNKAKNDATQSALCNN